MGNPFNDALSHVIKHSGSDVYGFLVANKTDMNIITGSIPLFHSRMVSMPLLRIALSMIEELPELQIVALYYASEVYTDKVPPVAKWIMNELHDTLKRNDILCIQYSGELLKDVDQLEWPFRPIALNGEKGSNPEKMNFKVAFDSNEFIEILKTHEYATTISDFEDHINNPKNRWLRIYS